MDTKFSVVMWLLWIPTFLSSGVVARQVAMDTKFSVLSSGCYGYQLHLKY